MDTKEIHRIDCGINEENRRLDRVIRITFSSIPLSLIQKSIRTGLIRVNGNKSDLGYRLKKRDSITVPRSIIPAGREAYRLEPPVTKPVILHENRHLLFVNKQKGVLVHGKESLLQGVQWYLGDNLNSKSAFHPGPLHRLDRNSSGIVCFGKTAPGARRFSSLLKKGSLRKYYIALADGVLLQGGEWRDHIQRDRMQKKSFISSAASGREAVLSVEPLSSSDGKTVILVRLHTGLTHQIRIQCAHRGFPLTGDRKYGSPAGKDSFLLHAYALCFDTTDGIVDKPAIRAPLPPESRQRFEQFFGKMEWENICRQIDTHIAV